jgi:hypothetical protein
MMARSAFRVAVLLAAGLLVATCAWPQTRTKTRKVIFVMTDGLRWQEVFQGADAALMNKENGAVTDVEGLRKEYWRESLAERREVLMPFLWNVIAKQGQIYGNREAGAEAYVTNGKNFSYPGYNETFTGFADPKIDSNDKILNANTNVFEWLNTKPAFRGRVAAAVNWDVLPWILNAPRAGFPVWSSFQVPEGTERLSVPSALTEMAERGQTIWSGVSLDTFVGYAAKHAVRTLKPHALYVSFGETDDWAHEGNYERYLKAAHEFDRFIGELWSLTQSLPEYRGTTTFLISVDHGRGPAPVAWKNHGREIPDSAFMWLAALGPDIAARGERSQTPLIRQAQIAATVAALVGQDYHAAFPRSAAPIRELLDGAKR